MIAQTAHRVKGGVRRRVVGAILVGPHRCRGLDEAADGLVRGGAAGQILDPSTTGDTTVGVAEAPVPVLPMRHEPDGRLQYRAFSSIGAGAEAVILERGGSGDSQRGRCPPHVSPLAHT